MTTRMRFSPMQQRSAIRRAISVPCDLVRSRDGSTIGRIGLDLSESGMLVGALDDTTPGEEVKLSFTFTDFALSFHIEGRVARVLAGRRTKDVMPAIAVAFGSLDPVARLILRGNLRRIPPVLPARARRVDYAGTIAQLLAA